MVYGLFCLNIEVLSIRRGCVAAAAFRAGRGLERRATHDSEPGRVGLMPALEIGGVVLTISTRIR